MRAILWSFAFAILANIAPAVESSLESEAESAIWIENSSFMTCAPQTLRLTDMLVLTLQPNHGMKELAIRRESDGMWFFLIVQSPPEDMKVLMSREDMLAATRIEIPVSIIGYAWVIDRGSEKVFTTSGIYTVFASPALESEMGGYKCSVTFSGK